ncbi:MAG: hypothetical protein L0Y73_03175, partial [Candidatus Aminicenantes bacterium]|nr:hypothetical protein [Candidatus Aminicenantes bacterium]
MKEEKNLALIQAVKKLLAKYLGKKSWRMFPTPTEAAISPPPGGDYEKKIDLSDQLSVDYGKHRSGWSYAIQDFKVLHNPDGVLL